MTLKPTDIRIGNFLLHKDSEYIACVTEIHKNRQGLPDPHEYWLSATGVYRDYMCNYPLSGFEPIKLSEEWIKKFKQIDFRYDKYVFVAGMVRYDIDINHKRYQSEDITIIAEYDNIQLAIFSITYLHQLQNLYYALTGEELKLTYSK